MGCEIPLRTLAQHYLPADRAGYVRVVLLAFVRLGRRQFSEQRKGCYGTQWSMSLMAALIFYHFCGPIPSA